MSLSLCRAALLGVLSLALLGSEVYTWIDEDGVVHFSDRAPESGSATAIELPEPPATPAAASAYEQVDEDTRDTQRSETTVPAATAQRSATQVTPERARCFAAWAALQDLDRRGDVYEDEAGVVHHADSLHAFWYESYRRWLSDSERRERIERYEKEMDRYCDLPRREVRKQAAAWNRERIEGQCHMARAKLKQVRGDDGKTPRQVIEDIEELILENCGPAS